MSIGVEHVDTVEDEYGRRIEIGVDAYGCVQLPDALLSPEKTAELIGVLTLARNRAVAVRAAQADDYLHELVFTDRAARPAKWETRCGRTDVPLTQTMSPAPGSHYQVTCPDCIAKAIAKAAVPA